MIIIIIMIVVNGHQRWSLNGGGSEVKNQWYKNWDITKWSLKRGDLLTGWSLNGGGLFTEWYKHYCDTTKWSLERIGWSDSYYRLHYQYACLINILCT